MHKTEFSTNPNGKLFIHHFNDVRLYDAERHFIGAEHEIFLNKHFLGIATVQALVGFRFKHIRDVLAFTIYGKPSHYLAAMLKQFYKEVNDDTEFVHLIWHWKQRNLAVQEPLIKDWWDNVRASTKTEEVYQSTLAL